jgi:predicted nuclease of predicted toxin-antitoxin system
MSKILVDACFSWKVANYLSNQYDQVVHVTNTELGIAAHDYQIYEYASENGYTILTLDYDFIFISRLRKSTKVIHISNAAGRAGAISDALILYTPQIQNFIHSSDFLLSIRLNITN